jgi:uncharacterized protein YbaR (Trm112 family)
VVLIELIDDLRCPRSHEETWLVASAERTEGRDITHGTLGCPICHAEYPIRDGVAWFDQPLRGASATLAERAGGEPEEAMRLAAFLDLSEPQGFALLAGDWARVASRIRDVVPPHLILLNPSPFVSADNGISVLAIQRGIPLAAGSCRGVALDAAHAGEAHLEAAVRVLRPRGRLVAPATVPVPSGLTELARDTQLWVAERAAAPPRLVTLQGRGG